MDLFHRARFFAGAPTLSALPRASAAEVAFAGRSNSGKSSAINALLNRKSLALVSKTPGRTRQLNFFDLGEGRYLVDLPGYGYAKVSRGEQAQWETFLPTYLRSREVLRGLVLIMDVRHPFTELDALLMELFAPTGKPVHVLLTKADKLSRGAALAALRKVEVAMASGAALASCQLFSSRSKEGVDDARSSLEQWLRLDTSGQPTAQ